MLEKRVNRALEYFNAGSPDYIDTEILVLFI